MNSEMLKKIFFSESTAQVISNFAVITFTIAALVCVVLFINQLGFSFTILQTKIKRLFQWVFFQSSRQPPEPRKISKLGTFCEKIKPQLSPEAKTYISLILLVILSRLFIYMIGFMAEYVFRNNRVDIISSFKSIWNRWDSLHYLTIAENWYTAEGNGKFLIVFFPLYPFLLRLFSVILRDYFVSGIVISNISLMFASVYLYKLVRLDFCRKAAFRAVLFMLICPLSFFYGLVFTESLFIALSIITYYFIRTNKWSLVGLFGLCAALTRIQGLLLIIPAIMELALLSRTDGGIRGFIRKLPDLLLIPMGLFIYLFLNKTVTGDWFKYLQYQKENWNNTFGLFFVNIKNHVNNALTWDASISMSVWIPQVVCFFIVLLIILVSFNKIRISYVAYMLVYIFVSYSPTWLLSGPRYIMSLFPIYIYFAILTQNRVIKYMLFIFSAMLLAFFTVAFVTEKQIM